MTSPNHFRAEMYSETMLLHNIAHPNPTNVQSAIDDARTLAMVREYGTSENIPGVPTQLEDTSINGNWVGVLATEGLELLESEDPNNQEAGLAYLDWVAKFSPHITDGNELSRYARDIAEEENSELVKKIFYVALEHFRNTITQEDFVLSGIFISEFNSTVARIEEVGFSELFKSIIKEFAPVIIQTAEAYDPTQDDEFESNLNAIEDALETVATELYESDPEVAAMALEKISTPMWKKLALAGQRDRELSRLFKEGKFGSANKLLSENTEHTILRLWPLMVERLVQDPESDPWGNQVLDTILNANPDYFSQYLTPYHDADMFLGRNFGKVIGILNRSDLVNKIVSPDDTDIAHPSITAGIMFGYGVRQHVEASIDLTRKMTPQTLDSYQSTLDSLFAQGVHYARNASLGAE